MKAPSPVWAAAGGACIAASDAIEPASGRLLALGLVLVAVYVVRWAVAR